MEILSGTGILDGTGILSGRGILFQPGILTPSLMDDNAAAYISAVEAAGATVTGAQRTFINDFYVAAKADYYTSLKRLYLPIWGVAAANAIDMIGLTSGTFNGGVTHGAGFVQGNGTTGYFDFGVSPNSAGLSNNNGLISSLIYEESSPRQSLIGSRDGFAAREVSLFEISNTSFIGFIGRGFGVDTYPILAFSPRTGIATCQRTGADVELHLKKSSGDTNASLNTGISATILTSRNTYAMATNNDGTASGFTNAKMGSYALGLYNANIVDFHTHLKTLWEGCTGLTLP
jgi:hypothetical protein